MKKDKVIEYMLLVIICMLTFFNLFLPNVELQKWTLTIFLVLYTIVLTKIFKFKKVDNVNKSKIIILIMGLSIIYVFLLYLIGIYVGFYKNINAFTSERIFKTILPYIIIVICSEIIRQIFVTTQNKINTIIVTIVLVLAEITIFINTSNIWNLGEMLILLGYVTFPSISINLLCNYIVKKYGIIPNIVYRIITTIYIYIFGILPDIYMFFQSIYKIIFPYIIYIIIDDYFENSKFKKVAKRKKVSIISLVISIFLITSIVMLISCKFKYGILVVGSSSMAGTIDKGDAIVYEKFDGRQLEKGQVIVFTKDNIKTIHAIENVQVKNNETIYYTKGTNNQQQDEGYRTNNDIIGVVKFRIIDIGWPTIWINDVFER
jgi:signal peptidase I